MPAKPIVAATDGSAESLRAVDWAVREAVLRGAPLRLVCAAALLPAMIGNHAISGFESSSRVPARAEGPLVPVLPPLASRAART